MSRSKTDILRISELNWIRMSHHLTSEETAQPSLLTKKNVKIHDRMQTKKENNFNLNPRQDNQCSDDPGLWSNLRFRQMRADVVNITSPNYVLIIEEC